MTDELDSLRLGAADSLFLDLDGTLADIVADPDSVALDAMTAAALADLASRLGGALAILSGRDVRDLARRTPQGLWRLGGHGLEVLAPTEPPASQPPGLGEAVLAPLREQAQRRGVRLEQKGPVAALHFRAAPEAEFDCKAAAKAAVEHGQGLVWQAGKMVVEVKPESAHKGRALLELSARAPFAGRRPIMIGDDTTDEDAIVAAQSLGGVGVRVGQGASNAALRAADPAAVRAWLVREAAVQSVDAG